MELITELPITDLTKIKMETFLSDNSPEVIGAGLYLLELANGEAYVKDIITFEYFGLSDSMILPYKLIRNYFNTVLPDVNVEEKGPLLTLTTGYTYKSLIKYFQKGSIALDITGSIVELPPKRKVKINLESSEYLTAYLLNKKVTHVKAFSELVIIQEFAFRYNITDEQLLSLCDMIKMNDLYTNYAILADVYVPNPVDMLNGEVSSSYAATTIDNSNEWNLLKMLLPLLEYHIEPEARLGNKCAGIQHIIDRSNLKQSTEEA